MLNFVHDIPTKVYFGKGQISHLAEALMPYGKKVLLAYGGGSIKKMGLYDEVMKILKAEGCQVTELSGIAPNPRIESVREGVALCREKEIDVILAVGGGSVIDCAKAVAAGFYYEGDPWNMIMNWDGDGRALPLVDILTISATGSEYDPMGVISNLKEQEKIGSVFCYPAVSICDPTYTFSVSAYQTAAGAADIMSHIFEGYFSKTEDSDLFEGIAETVLRSVMKNAPIAIREPENYSARANLMANSSIACSGIPEYGKEGTGWPCHAMEHQLSAYYDITHGVGLAILTPRWMRHILAKDPSVTPRFARFARNVMGLSGTDEAALAQSGIDALEAYFVSTGIPMSLGAVGIDRAHFSAMATKACRGGRLNQGFVPLDEKDVEAIFEACL